MNDINANFTAPRVIEASPENITMLRFRFQIDLDRSCHLMEKGLARYTRMIGRKAIDVIAAAGICRCGKEYYLEFFCSRETTADPFVSGVSIEERTSSRDQEKHEWDLTDSKLMTAMDQLTSLFDALYKLAE